MSGQANTLHLRIITPKRVIRDEYAEWINAPTAEGEITVLPHHVELFSQLVEGVLRFKLAKSEEYLAIGGGFLETDGDEINILVSRAYGQDEIDEKLTERAIEDAKKILAKSQDRVELSQARALLTRSTVDLKLLKKRRKKPTV